MRRLLSFFLAGLILGASIVNLFTGRIVDMHRWELERLHEELNKKETQVQKLLKSPIKTIAVEEVRVKVQNEDKNLCLAVEKAVTPSLEDLIGCEAEGLDPLAVRNILHNRRIVLDKNTYKVFVQGVLVSEKIIVYLEVKPVGSF